MKKVFILCFFSILIVSCGQKIVELSNPNFDGNSNTNDEEVDDDTALTDHDSPVTDDDDSPLTDHDSPVTDHDSPLTDDDSPVTDNDSPVTDDDVINCTEGELRCNSEKTWVQKCVGGNWTNDEDCTAPLKMCVENSGTFSCADLTCVPDTKLCESKDVYTCDTDGMGTTLSKNCNASQYCDETIDPVDCKDMVCTPDADFCDGDVLKTCNNIGSSSFTAKDCTTDGGTCDSGLLDCVYTAEVGGTSSFDRTGQRGNFFNCTKNVEVLEFAQELEYTGSKDISWAIYEAEGNSTTYSRIFIKSAATTGTGKAYYSTGVISVNLVNGKKYIFAIGWSGNSTVYYGYNTAEIGFGEAVNAHSLGSPSMAESLIDPARYDIVFNQQIKFVE